MSVVDADIGIQTIDTERQQQLVRAARFTAIAGTAFSLLTLAAFFMVPPIPGENASQEQIARFADEASDTSARIAALYLLPFAIIAFIWFIVALRMWIPRRSVRRVDALFSNLQLVSGIVFIMLFSTAAAAMSIRAVVIRDDDGSFESISSFAFPQYGNSLFFVFAIRMGAMFVFSTSTIGRQTGVLPSWFAYLGYVTGLVMLLSGSFNRWMIYSFPVWTLAISVLIWMFSRDVSAARSAELILTTRSPESASASDDDIDDEFAE